MDSKAKNILIAKYGFMMLIILNILCSIWVIIYDLNVIKRVQENFPDDWHTNEKHEGSTAQYWFAACVLVMIINLIISMIGLYGAKTEQTHFIMIVSALFAVIAVYGAWDKYMKGSIASYLIPLITCIMGILFGSLCFIQMNEESSEVPGAKNIQYIIRNQPTTPQIESNFEEQMPFKSTTIEKEQYYQQYYSQYGYGPQQTQAIGDYYAHQTSATSTIYPSTQASYLSTMMNAAAAAASTRVKSNSKNDSLGKDSSGNDHDDDDDDDPTIAKPNQPKLSNILNYSCNEKMGLNPLIYTNIQQSPYFKNNLFQLKTYNEVIDEIYYSVRHLEPWEKGSRKVSGQTGMCGSVRGVGAGGIISTPFCILYKLFTLKLTRKQVMAMTRHKDSPYIRSLGLMYIRFTQPSRDLWHWFEPYLEDDEQVDPKAGGGSPMTIGQMVRHFLTKLEWFSTLFPRIPRHVQLEIEKKLNKYDAEMKKHSDTSNMNMNNKNDNGDKKHRDMMMMMMS
ncbi:PRP38 pre-mRNA processing factor 38 domain-containing protein B [Dermatophagoides farinae]|uniref:Pre-mRNA-splicing factor 38 n=1 Tax=Dermatophagoides farinae TaxID=6954 RepID=A0A922L893_DERFA|nr:PRP38 pre-mRNA processing factor 38 domain-containing protein B [Dermatophagoides farinae]